MAGKETDIRLADIQRNLEDEEERDRRDEELFMQSMDDDVAERWAHVAMRDKLDYSKVLDRDRIVDAQRSDAQCRLIRSCVKKGKKAARFGELSLL